MIKDGYSMDKIAKGKPVADNISKNLMKDIGVLHNGGFYPRLAIVRVGKDPNNLAYERGILSRFKKLGLATEVKEFKENISEEIFVKELEAINKDENIHGILILRPLPKQLNENNIQYKINPNKDIDCLNPLNEAKLLTGDKTGFLPCTPAALMELLKYYKIKIQGKNAVVVGRSMVVGKPAALLLLNENATVTICHSKTENMREITKSADILVVAIGRANFIDASYVSKNTVVIDVGINVDSEGNLCGDVDLENVINKVASITPVPGGVGAVTTTILAKQLIKACKIQNNL